MHSTLRVVRNGSSRSGLVCGKNYFTHNRTTRQRRGRLVDKLVDVEPLRPRMLNDPIGKREPRLFICSIHDPALAIAEDAPSCAIEHDLVNFVRLRGGNVKSILLIEAQMPQALRGYSGEERDGGLRIDLQHLVVSIVDDIKISLPIERNSVWAVEKIALCK